MPPIAEQAMQISEPLISALVVGLVAVGLLVLGQLALTAKQIISGNKGERQIEPTQLHSITSELAEQTRMLSDINREVGEVKTTVDLVKGDVGGFHQRVGGISRELASTTARVEGLEKWRHRDKT